MNRKNQKTKNSAFWKWFTKPESKATSITMGIAVIIDALGGSGIATGALSTLISSEEGSIKWGKIAQLPLANYLFSTFDKNHKIKQAQNCLLYTSPSPRDKRQSRMPSSA